MTPQERDLIAQFFDRVGGASQGGFNRGSVPQTQPLAPIDPDANALIAQQFQQHPEAQYRVTQTAIVQEAALAEAQNRIRQLQWQLEQTQHAMQQAAQQAPAQSRGFFSSLFGGGGGQRYQPTTPPPQPQYPPNYQPGMFQQAGRGGSGFLGSALTTAAGVAGGMVAGNALMDLFGGHQGMGGGFGQGAGDGGGFLGGAFGGGGGGADPFNQAGVDTSGTDPFGGGGGGGGFDQGGDPFGGGGGGDPFGSGGGGDPFGGGGGGFDDSST